MNENLYDITERYLNVLNDLRVDEETGEIINGIELDEVEGELKEKAEAVACYIKGRQAFADSLKAEEKALKARRESVEKRVEWLKDWLEYNMKRAGMPLLETPKARVSFRKSEQVVVQNEDEIPEEYIKVKTETAPDKAAIKKAIKSGVLVPGVAVVVNQNIQIK